MKWTLLTLLLCAALFTNGQTRGDFELLDMRSGLPESRIRALGQTVDGRMVIVTAGTLTLYDGTRFTVFHLQPDAEYPLPAYRGKRQLTCDSTGMIWLRNDHSLYVVDARRLLPVKHVDSLLAARGLSPRQVAQWPTDSMRKDGTEHEALCRMAGEEVSALLRDSYGGVWVGLKDGGLLYSNKARRRQFHTSDKPFGHNPQFPFCSPRASQLSSRYAPSATNCTLDGRRMAYAYLGTRRGILVIDREDRLVATIDERDGLSTNNVVSLIGDQRGDVWAATANGLTRVRQTGRDSFNIVNYGLLDGIDTKGREFRTCQIHSDSTGLIEVGFAGGTCVFHPDSVVAPRYTFVFPRVNSEASNPPSFVSRLFGSRWLVVCLLLLMAVVVVLLCLWHNRVGRRRTPGLASASPDSLAFAADLAQQTAADGGASANELFLEKLKAHIEEHLADEDFSVQSLSAMMAMDRTVLYRRMQAVTGVAPSVYIKGIRFEVAKRLLRDTEMPIADIAARTGFSTSKYFSASFKEAFGVSPAEFRKQHL